MKVKVIAFIVAIVYLMVTQADSFARNLEDDECNINPAVILSDKDAARVINGWYCPDTDLVIKHRVIVGQLDEKNITIDAAMVTIYEVFENWYGSLHLNVNENLHVYAPGSLGGTNASIRVEGYALIYSEIVGGKGLYLKAEKIVLGPGANMLADPANIKLVAPEITRE